MKSFTTAIVLGVILALAYSRESTAATWDNGIRGKSWTSCNFTTKPIISCHDCTTRMICKPIGGLLLSCMNPYKPHCNNGICSSVPSAGCA